MEIIITPCVNSLLYSPLYLAIIILWERGRASLESFTEWPMHLKVDEEVYTIGFTSAPTGDKPVVEKLLEKGELRNEARGQAETKKSKEKEEYKKKEALWIGVCDPITVLNHNKTLKAQGGEEWKPALVIPGVFIDRINLSVFVRPPGRGKDRPPKEVILENIIRQLESPTVHSEKVFNKMDPDDLLACTYWSSGETTRFLAERYLDIKERTPSDSALPQDLIEQLRTKQIDFAITHEPWNIDPGLLSRDKVRTFCRECFPGMQFPFSCFATPANPNEHQRKAIRMLLESVYAAIHFIHHYPEDACAKLTTWKQAFGYYGLPEKTQVEAVASRAIHHFLKIGCYSETMWPEPIAWDFALNLDPAWRGKIDGNVDWKRKAWDILDKTVVDVRTDEVPQGKRIVPFHARTTGECMSFRAKVWNACLSLR